MPIDANLLNLNKNYPPHSLLPWLEYVQSLTQKLKHTAGDASLEVLNEAWSDADDWDKQILNLSSEKVLHREILMRAWENPCWYARTILPKKTYDRHDFLFDRLQKETLGELIFGGAGIERLSIQHFLVNEKSKPYGWLNDSMHQGEKTLWARLSEFSVHNEDSFYLLEILLPGLLRYCH